MLTKKMGLLIFIFLVSAECFSQTIAGQSRKLTQNLTTWFFTLTPIAIIYVGWLYKKGHAQAEARLWQVIGAAFLVTIATTVATLVR